MQEEDHNVLPTGFVISVPDPWLGASPDGIVKAFDHGFVEVKCPFLCKHNSFEDVA